MLSPQMDLLNVKMDIKIERTIEEHRVKNDASSKVEKR